MSSTHGNGDTIDRLISWNKAAQKDFQKFPQKAQLQITAALEMAASGRKSDNAKPLQGFGTGVFEVALRYRSEAYRTVYVLKLDDKVWVLHAFQKKSKTGIKTPSQDIKKIKTRIKALKEKLKNEQERRH